MRIVCLTTFLDGTRRFEVGDTLTVSDADGQRFIDNGWAQAADSAGATAAPVAQASKSAPTLAVQGGRLGMSASKAEA